MLVDLILLVVLKTFQQILRILPEGAQSAMGVSLGRLAFLFLSERRLVAFSNLSRVFPDLDDEGRCRIVRRCFEKLGVNFVESLVLPYVPKKEYTTRFIVVNRENIEGALEQKKGVLALAFHYANWEIMGVISYLLQRDFVALARPMKKRSRLNDFLNSLRSATGLTIILNTGTGKDVMRCLRENKVVAILADQREKRSQGVYVELFGEKVPTSRGIATIGMKTGAAVVPIHAVRQGFLRYRLVCSRPLVMERDGNINDLIYKNTRKINEFLESIVMEQPDEWFWVHRRWGRRPKAERERVKR